MSQNNTLKGVLLVGLGATSYGMLATFVKLAYSENYTTAEVTASQFVFGILGMFLIGLYYKFKNKEATENPSKSDIVKLMLAGTSLGMTSVFYYLAVRYINVSIAIVLLMQTVWMGVILEYFLDKVVPSMQKIISVAVVLAASSFTTTMFTANRIALHIAPHKRSLYMLFGGAVIVAVFGFITQFGPNNFQWAKELFSGINENNVIQDFNFGIFTKWGIVIAVFGTIIPPLLMNAGFPHTGLGLGSIISSVELPVSVMMAFFILGETVIFSQWVGIVLILIAIVIMNIQFKKK